MCFLQTDADILNGFAAESQEGLSAAERLLLQIPFSPHPNQEIHALFLEPVREIDFAEVGHPFLESIRRRA